MRSGDPHSETGDIRRGDLTLLLLSDDRPDSQGQTNYLHHNDAIKPRDTNIKYFGILRSTISYRHGVLRRWGPQLAA